MAARLRGRAARARDVEPGGRRCSPPPASGGTWCRSPGTSRRSRTPTASPTCSGRPSTRTDPSGFAVEEEPTEADGVTTAWITFETAVGRGRGLLRLVEEDGAEGLDPAHHAGRAQGPRGGHAAPPARRASSTARTATGRPGWSAASRRRPSSASASSPTCSWSAAARAASRLGARLRQLGVPALVIDKHARPGDQWRGRYKSLCLHDPVWYDHLPYLKFPDNWPVFAPKDKIGDWLESYTKVMEIPYWPSTEATSRVVLRGDRRVDRAGRARRQAAHPAPEAAGAGHRHVRQGRTCPTLPGQDVFTGDQHHSSAHPGPDAVRRQAGGGHRQQQLGLRHLRGALGARRRRDDGAALLDPHREERQPDGDRPGRPLLGAGGRRGRDHREGRPDLRLAPLPDPARVPDPALRPDAREGPGLLRPAGEGRLRARLGCRTAPGCS